MELDEKRLREILTEQRREYERFTEERFERQRELFERFTEGKLIEQRKQFEQFAENKFIEQRKQFEQFSENKFIEQRQEFQRYIGIQKEDFDSKIQLIAEQYMEIKETLASHGEMLGALAEDVSIIKKTLAGKVDREEFLDHERRISALEAKGRK